MWQLDSNLPQQDKINRLLVAHGGGWGSGVGVGGGLRV